MSVKQIVKQVSVDNELYWRYIEDQPRLIDRGFFLSKIISNKMRA